MFYVSFDSFVRSERLQIFATLPSFINVFEIKEAENQGNAFLNETHRSGFASAVCC